MQQLPSVPLWPKINPMRAKEQQIWADVQIKCFIYIYHSTLCVNLALAEPSDEGEVSFLACRP